MVHIGTFLKGTVPVTVYKNIYKYEIIWKCILNHNIIIYWYGFILIINNNMNYYKTTEDHSNKEIKAKWGKCRRNWDLLHDTQDTVFLVHLYNLDVCVKKNVLCDIYSNPSIPCLDSAA